MQLINASYLYNDQITKMQVSAEAKSFSTWTNLFRTWNYFDCMNIKPDMIEM